ncbi:conserved unknown protein [Ectocarpus siliculosus]|uniref:Ankyrin repeat protein n=1 Tax=Ectocarpus siliculosus TaxID=2880 RepID=D7FMP0_ECTSI|nr:conserved unknown protein [Ectocarpus siliculosus]|eukprot:CBJ25937.1 conserved unknown protein [Ectocarpus siliculosus]
MPRLLSEEIDDAVREVKFIEEALSGSAGCDAGGSGSYLGLTDRGALLDLLLCARRQLNLLREKEVAILKSSAAAGGRSNQHFEPSPSAATGVCQPGGGVSDTRRLSDVTTWMSCRSLLDSMGVGDIRLVHSAVPRAELSVIVDALHLFQWPGAAAARGLAAGARYRAAGEQERAGLRAYLNAIILPGDANEWVVPVAGGQDPGDAAESGGHDNNSSDFLSVPCDGSWRRRRRSGHAGDRWAAATEGGGDTQGAVRGGVPSAAICLSEAISCGGPASGLRVLLEVVLPEATSASANGTAISSCKNGEDNGCRRGRGSCRGGLSPRAAGAGGQQAAGLYRAIGVLVAANRRSPLTRPVVVLTDLQASWKLLWLGGARSGLAPAGEAAAAAEAAGTAFHHAAATTVDGDDVDVFVWRMSPRDAISVVRSMLDEEAVGWDGQVSWAPRQGDAVAAPAASGGGGTHGDDGFHALAWASEGAAGRGGGGGGGVAAGESKGPMQSLRDRHLVGRRNFGRPHSCPRHGGSRAASSAAAANGGSGGGGGGVEAYMGGIGRTSSPPLAMEMALRREHASSFTGNSLPGQWTATGGSFGEGGEFPPRECRAFSAGVQHASDGLDRAAEMMGRRSTFANLYPLHGGGGGGNSGGGGGAGDEGYSVDDRFRGRLSNGNHHSTNGGATPREHRGGSFDNDGRGLSDNSSTRQRSFTASSPHTRPLSPPSAPVNPLADPTVLRHLIPFAAGDGFLFVAGISRSWRDAWGVERPPETDTDAAVQSPSRLGWARASGLGWGPSVCARAASGGHLATLRYARALGCPWDWTCCALATTKALVPVSAMIQWAASQPASSSSSVVGDDPLRPKRLEVLKWCRENGCPWDEATTSEAAREGNMEILRYAVGNGCPRNVLMCAYAAAAGHLETLKWAREEEGCGWNEATCAFAAAGGHLEVLEWARERGAPWGEETCASAARGGRLEVLKWLRKHGCKWGAGTCGNAAEGGHFDVLKYARGEGCPWTEAACTLAAREGHLEILKWCRKNGCNWVSATFRAAAGVGNQEMLCFLFEEGCPWDRRTCAAAARNSDLETLKWLRLKGCPWDSRVLDAAAEVGAMDVFEWAMSNKCPS